MDKLKVLASGKFRFGLIFLFLAVGLFAAGLKKSDNSTFGKKGRYIAVSSTDTRSYIDAAENLSEKGEFYFETNDKTKIYIGRGWYYGMFYCFFRLFLPQEFAFDAVALLQWVILAIALTCLLKMIDKSLKNKWLLWIFASCFMLIPIATRYVFGLNPESFTLSFFLLFCYFYQKFIFREKAKYLLVSGLFLGLTCVMKPYFFPVYALIGLIYFFQKRNFKLFFRYVVIISIPVVLICMPFTVRNLVRFKTFAPVQNTFYGGIAGILKTHEAMRQTLALWGESYVTWENESLGAYFFPLDENVRYNRDFPQRLLVEGYTLQDVENLRVLCQIKEPNDFEENAIVEEFMRMRKIYAEQKPFEIVLSPFRQMLLLVRSPLYITATNRLSVSYIFQLFKQILYYLILFAGFAGVFWYGFVSNKKMIFLTLLVLYLVCLFGFWTLPERRFFIHGYFILYIGAAYLFDKIIQKVQRKL